MEGFSQVLTCAFSTHSLRGAKNEWAILPPRLRRLLKWEVEDVPMVVSTAARAAVDPKSRECILSIVLLLSICVVLFCGLQRVRCWC